MNTKNNITQDQLEAFERYFNDTMEADERQEFDLKIKENPAFRALAKDTQLLFTGIENAALKSELDSFHEEMDGVIQLDTSKQIKGNSRFMMFSIAASVAVLLGVFWVFNSGSSSEKLYAKHFTPDPGLPTVMSTTDQYEFYDAMVSYKQENYELAIKKWEAILPNKPNNDTLNYFLGVAQLANKNEVDAIKYLEEVLKNKESIFQEDTYFYLGLAQLKAKNMEAAKVSFSKSSLAESQSILQEINK